jgi:hypothetical protein
MFESFLTRKLQQKWLEKPSLSIGKVQKMLQIFAEALLLATGQRPNGQTNQKRRPAPHDGTRGAERPGPFTPPNQLGG